MPKILIKIVPLVLILITLNFCSEKDNPTSSNSQIFNDNLVIHTEKIYYTYGIDYTNWININCSLVNSSIDTFYSKIGDGVNASLDQDYLFVAEGSDAFSQKFDSIENKWSNARRGILIEGTKIVSLLPNKNYILSYLSKIDSGAVGKYRFLVNYYKSNGNSFSTDTLKDTSNVFYIN